MSTYENKTWKNHWDIWQGQQIYTERISTLHTFMNYLHIQTTATVYLYFLQLHHITPLFTTTKPIYIIHLASFMSFSTKYLQSFPNPCHHYNYHCYCHRFHIEKSHSISSNTIIRGVLPILYFHNYFQLLKSVY